MADPLPTLEDNLTDVTIIRTTLETLAEFGDDEALRAEMTSRMLAPARLRLAGRLRQCAEAFRRGEAPPGLDLAAFQRFVIRIASGELDMGTVCRLAHCEESPDATFDLLGSEEVAAAGEMPPGEFAALLLIRLADAAARDEAYVDLAAFHRRVNAPFLAVYVAAGLNTDPAFYHTHKPGAAEAPRHLIPIVQRMSRIYHTFKELNGKGALVAYVTAGDPSLEITERIVPALVAGGADIVELGLPFSDPLLDGPAIQASAQRAIEGGATPTAVLESVSRMRAAGVTAPIVLMTCYNLVLRPGLEAFAACCHDAGVDGVIVTDLPPEEAAEWKAAADKHGVDTVFLLAPTSTDARIETVAGLATGFIYCVARAGVTGEQTSLPEDLHALLSKIRSHTDTPIAVGFGVSTADHVRTVWQWANGAVVGSAIVNEIARNADAPDLADRVTAFVKNLKPE